MRRPATWSCEVQGSPGSSLPTGCEVTHPTRVRLRPKLDDQPWLAGPDGRRRRTLELPAHVRPSRARRRMAAADVGYAVHHARLGATLVGLESPVANGRPARRPGRSTPAHGEGAHVGPRGRARRMGNRPPGDDATTSNRPWSASPRTDGRASSGANRRSLRRHGASACCRCRSTAPSGRTPRSTARSRPRSRKRCRAPRAFACIANGGGRRRDGAKPTVQDEDRGRLRAEPRRGPAPDVAHGPRLDEGRADRDPVLPGDAPRPAPGRPTRPAAQRSPVLVKSVAENPARPGRGVGVQNRVWT